MKGDIRINDSGTAWEDWGVNMGDGFIDALTEPLTPKEYVENESRLEHGKRVVVDDEGIKFASRELTLDFTISGRSPEDLRTKKRRFLEAMYRGSVTIAVPKVNNEVYHLLYKGKGTEYNLNASRTFCHMVLKFEEPDPSHRYLSAKVEDDSPGDASINLILENGAGILLEDGGLILLD